MSNCHAGAIEHPSQSQHSYRLMMDGEDVFSQVSLGKLVYNFPGIQRIGTNTRELSPYGHIMTLVKNSTFQPFMK